MYGAKYRHSFCNRYKKLCHVDILEEDYSGSVTEVDAGPQPIIISYESQHDFKFSERRSSTATVTLIGATQFELTDLWTSDERKYRVELWIDNVLDWRGYVVPNGFRQDFTGGKYYAQVTASDGLATLDGIKFAEVEGSIPDGIDDTAYIGKKTFVEIISLITRKLELDLNFWIAVDIYATQMNDGPDDDPLNQSKVNVETYINDSTRDDLAYWEDIDSVWDCGRVLDNVLRIFACKMYQSGGAWKIKRVNSDTDDTPARYWRKYNSLGVFLESREVNENLTVLCSGPDPVLLAGASLSMDRVFKQTRVNYKYTYIREGDTPINMFRNGNFEPIWGGFPQAPQYWYFGWRAGQPWPGIERVSIPLPNPGGPQVPQALHFTSQMQGDKVISQNLPGISQGDNIMFQWWQKANGSSIPDYYWGTYEIILVSQQGNITRNYSLVNDGVNTGSNMANLRIKTRWIEDTDYPRIIFQTFGIWQKIDLDIPPAPASGNIVFRIWGMTRSKPTFKQDNQKAYWYTIQNGEVIFAPRAIYAFSVNDATLQCTGFFAGLIKNVSSEEVPDLHTYGSVNEDGFYTDQHEPFEIFNSDLNNKDHMSNIVLLDEVPRKLFWNTIDDRYTLTSIGTILAQSIQDQYGKPSRIIEGGIKGENIEFGSRVGFNGDPDINGIRFIIQRGSFDIANNIFTGTLVEVSNSETPPDGTDGGNTVNPNWQPTGTIRCVKDGSGLNTGQTEYQEIDVNEASPTNGTTRWVPGGENLQLCPLGEPNLYYWGAQPVNYDPDNFSFYPLEEFSEPGYSKVIQVQFTNDGGKYLYFLHRDNLGLVTRIEGAYQGNTISDWQYLADTTIEGYTYRVLRMNYITGIFQDLDMAFFFE